MPSVHLTTSVAPTIAQVSIPLWLELLAVVVAGLSGGLTAAERKLDFVGATGLAIVCSLGGGLLRDVALQKGVYLIESDYAILFAMAAGLAAYYFRGIFKRLDSAIEWLDILSVGLFVVTGTDKAIVNDVHLPATLLMGVLTGVGGGLLRDVVLGDVPRIFRGSNFYAVCAVVGSLVYAAGVYAHLTKPLAAVLCVAATIGLRRASLRFGLVTPEPVDLTPRVVEAARKHRRSHE